MAFGVVKAPVEGLGDLEVEVEVNLAVRFTFGFGGDSEDVRS